MSTELVYWDELHAMNLNPWSPRKLQREWKRLRKLGMSWTEAEASMRKRGLFHEPIMLSTMFQIFCGEPGINAKVKP